MAHADLGVAIRDEIDRIISSPYPVTFSCLENILQRDDRCTAFEAFARANLCRLCALVDAICDQLETRPATFQVVSCLSYSRCFVTSFMTRHQDVVPTLLTYAENNAGNDLSLVLNFWKYWDHDINPPPAQFTGIFEFTFNAVIRQSSIESLDTTYTLLSSCPSEQRGNLPDRLLDSLVKQLGNVLKHKDDHSDAEGFLTLGILFHLARITCIDNAPRKKHLLDAVSYFSGDRAAKSLKYIALKLALLVRLSSEGLASDTIHILEIAVDIFTNVDRSVLEQWLSLRDTSGVLGRLCESASNLHIDVSVRLKLFLIISNFLTDDALSDQAARGFNAFLAMQDLDPLHHTDRLALSEAFSAFCPKVTKQNVTVLLNRIFNGLLAIRAHTDPLPNPVLLALCTRLRRGIAQSPTIQAAIIEWLGQAEPQNLYNVLSQQRINQDCVVGRDCVAEALESARQLKLEFVHLFIESLAGGTHESVTNVSAYSSQLLAHFRDLCCDQGVCDKVWPSQSSHTQVTPTLAVQCTPGNPRNSASWRDRIHALVEAETRHKQDSLTHFIHELVEDLELRCENVEQPLRQERELRENLEQRVSDLNAQIQELRDELQDRDLLLEGLENERLDVERAMQSQDRRGDVLQLRFNEVNDSLSKQQEAYDSTLKRLRDEFFEIETALKEELSINKNQVQDLREELRMAEQESDSRSEELATTKAEMVQLKKLLQVKTDDHQTVCQQLDSCRSDLTTLHTKFGCIQQQCSEASARAASLDVDYQRGQEEISALTKSIELAAQNYEKAADEHWNAMKELTTSHHMEIQVAQNRHQEELRAMRNEFDDKMTSLRADNERVKVEVAADAKQLKSHHLRLEKQVDRLLDTKASLEERVRDLTNLLAEKEIELDHLQAWQESMAKMLTRKPATVRRSTRGKACRQARSTSLATRTEPALASEPSTPVVPSATQEILSEEKVEPLSASSSFSNGPTPKRPKPRQQPFKVPIFQQPADSEQQVTPMKSPQRRKALQDVTTTRSNLSPIRPSRRQSLRSHKKGTTSKEVIMDPHMGSLKAANVQDGFDSDAWLATGLAPTNVAPVASTDLYDDTTIDEYL